MEKFYMPYNEFIIFTEDKEGLQKFTEEYCHLVDYYYDFSQNNRIFIIVCGFYLDEMEEGLAMFIDKFKVLETVAPTTDEILDKVSKGKKLTNRDKWLLKEYSEK